MASLVDTDASLRLMVAHLNSLNPRPDLVLLTGDLTDNGDPAEYRRLHEILEPLDLRYLLLAGNHDSVPELLAEFDSAVPPGVAEGHFSYVVDDFPVRLVALDTTVPGEEHGDFDEPRALWLEGRQPNCSCPVRRRF